MKEVAQEDSDGEGVSGADDAGGLIDNNKGKKWHAIHYSWGMRYTTQSGEVHLSVI